MHDGAHPLRHEGLNDVDLLLEVVLPQRPLPHHIDVQLSRGLHGTGVHALPELVRRPFRHHRNDQPRRRIRRRVPLVAFAPRSENGDEGHEKEDAQRHFIISR